jgi:hypothetical protein
MRLIGLHITKCAGTSLVSTIKQGLALDEYYLCSSIKENIKQNHPEIFERESLEKIKFVYGHYVHETMREIFDNEKDVWFTVLRDPLSRLRSEWFQLYKMRRLNGLDPMPVEQYLEIYSNSICQELVRAFPSASQSASSMLEAATAALQNFDYVFDSADFDKFLPSLQEFLEIDCSRRGFALENVSSSSEFFEDEFFLRSVEDLERSFDSSKSADALLYRSANIIRNPTMQINESLRNLDRPGAIGLVGRDSAMEIFMKHLAKYYRAELQVSGDLRSVSQQIDSRVHWLSYLRKNINM